ncbi:MAG: hypothetical protein ACRDQA_10790, partial [Nocardioidaceae bacterium]
LVVDLLMLFAVPLAGIGAYLAARRLVAGVAARVWMAAMYALLPVVSGAVTTGHLGTVVAIIVLPWVARSALALLDARPGRHWRAAWATGLGLSVAAAFAPVLWPLAVVMTLVGLVTRSIRARVVQVAVALVVPVLLLAPWSLRIFAHPHLLLTEAGAVDAAGASLAHAWLLPLGRLSAPGDAPWWLTVGVLVGALVALLRRDRRAPVAAAWVVAAVALAAAAVMSQRLLEVPGTDVQAPAWLGVPVVVAQAAAIVAVGLAADGVARFIGSGSFGWRQPLGAATAVVALLAPVAGLLWWVVSAPQGELGRADAVPLPAYMIDAMSDGQQRVLVVDTQGQVMTYRVFAGDGFRLGDESVRPRQSARDVTGLVTDMLAEGHPQDVRQLNDQAIGYVVLTSPAKPRAITELDSLPGLTRASSSGAVFSGWKVNAHGHKVTDPPSGADGPLDSHRPWWLALEALCWLVTIVLAAPGIRNWRAELETDESEGQT